MFPNFFFEWASMRTCFYEGYIMFPNLINIQSQELRICLLKSAQLSGEKTFSKLDLSQAYQLALLDNESKAYPYQHPSRPSCFADLQ